MNEIKKSNNEIYKINCPCNSFEKSFNLNNEIENSLVKCQGCHKYQHKDCIGKYLKMKPYYLCPDCQIENLDLFLEQKNKICRKLFRGKDLSKSTLVKCYFDLYNILPSNENNIDNDYILFRCLKIDEEGFNTLWPGFFDIYVNKVIITNPLKEEKELRREIAFRVNDKLKKKTYLKVSTNLKDFRRKTQNKLLLNFIGKYNKKYDYILSIDYVREKKLEEVIKNIPLRNHNKEKNDNFIYHEKVSLLDIYTDTDKIKIPARGWNCTHLSCFNLKTFLGYMEHTRLFKCPYCTQKVGLIYICNEMKNIIEKYYFKNINEITIDSNYNIIDDKNAGNQDIEIIKLNDSNDYSNNDNYSKDNNPIITNNSFSGIKIMNEINNIDYIIDSIFSKKKKKKKFEHKFVITIKTNWEKFFPLKSYVIKTINN